MKITCITFLFLVLLMPFNSSSQTFQKPSEGKAIVYFIWTYVELPHKTEYIIVKPKVGLELSPSVYFFDGDKYLGEKNSYDLLYYECEPGFHKFWIAGRYLNYLNAELLPNKVYLVYIPMPYTGALYNNFAYHDQSIIRKFLPNGIELLPLNKEYSSCKFIGLEDYIAPLLREDKHIRLQKESISIKHLEKRVAEYKRKSTILYQYKIEHNQFIPYLGPEMYIELPELDTLK